MISKVNGLIWRFVVIGKPESQYLEGMGGVAFL